MKRTQGSRKLGEQREEVKVRPLISSIGRALKPIAPVPFSAIEPCHEYTRSARSNFTTLNLRTIKIQGAEEAREASEAGETAES
jgi:hypothetical protein